MIQKMKPGKKKALKLSAIVSRKKAMKHILKVEEKIQ